MLRYTEFPECGGYDTERVHVEWYTDLIEETRICTDCPAQFVNSWDLFEQESEEVPE